MEAGRDVTPALISPQAAASLPSSVCLRVTRACNARCGFCLAPPTGHGVTYDSITRRLRWLAAIGVRKVNLSGGEPTIRTDLPDVVRTVQELGLVTALTTNGIRLPEPLLRRLRFADARVKVSVHGPRELHDQMLGVECFDRVNRNLLRLRDAGVAVAVQSVITRKRPDISDWMIEYCLREGIGKLRFVPFVPRGRGLLAVDEYQLSLQERDRLITAIDAASRRLAGQLDVDVLDFWTQEYYVLETDGQLQIQRESDAADSTVAFVGDMPLTHRPGESPAPSR